MKGASNRKDGVILTPPGGSLGSTEGGQKSHALLGTFLVKLPQACLLAFIRLYQLTLSALIGRQCRFHPTCSHYAYGAIRTHGAARGSLLAALRVARCGPRLSSLFGAKAAQTPAIQFDPVPALWQDALPENAKHLIYKLKQQK